jgi:hypothetical protein
MSHDKWLERDCTDVYKDEVPADYDPYDGLEPDDNNFVDDEYNNYIGG